MEQTLFPLKKIPGSMASCLKVPRRLIGSRGRPSKSWRTQQNTESRAQAPPRSLLAPWGPSTSWMGRLRQCCAAPHRRPPCTPAFQTALGARSPPPPRERLCSSFHSLKNPAAGQPWATLASAAVRALYERPVSHGRRKAGLGSAPKTKAPRSFVPRATQNLATRNRPD